MSACSREGCTRPMHGRGLCKAHHSAALRAGTIEPGINCRGLAVRLAALTSPEPNTGCWLWAGSRKQDWHGMLCNGGTRINAHRAAWLVHRGPIPEGLFVLHRCDNPLCVNPDHLFLGTQRDNMRDMTRKGRHARAGVPPCGSRNGRAKLTLEIVRLIVSRFDAGDSAEAIAADLPITAQYVRQLARQRRWGGVSL